MEYGDASGTALLDVKRRRWSSAVIEAIDADLESKLPPLISSDRPAGRLQPSTAKALGATTVAGSLDYILDRACVFSFYVA